MSLKYLAVAAALAATILPTSGAALARGGLAPMSPSMSAPGAIPRSPTSGALPASPNSAALPRSPSLPLTGQNLGASTFLAPLPPPTAMPRAPTTVPYQPPCGTYPLPQC